MFTFATCWIGVIVTTCLIKTVCDTDENSSDDKNNHITFNSLSDKMFYEEKANEILKSLDYAALTERTVNLINEFRRNNLCKSRVSERASDCIYNIRVELFSALNGPSASLKAGGHYFDGEYGGLMTINLHPKAFNYHSFEKSFLDSYIHELTHAIQEVNNDVYDFNKNYADRFCEKEARWVAKKMIKRHLKEIYPF